MKKYRIGGYKPEGIETNHRTSTRLMVESKRYQWTKERDTLSLGPVTMRPYSGARHQQGSIGSCVGNAAVKALEIMTRIEHGFCPELARLFVYYLAREAEVRGDERVQIKDDGTFVSEACDVMRRLGVPEERFWPHDAEKVNVSPAWMAVRQAHAHRISGFYRITSAGNDRLEAINIHLHSGHPVIFGMSVSEEIREYDAGEVLQMPTKPIIGGHSMCIVGVDGSGNYIVENSWGTGWGDDGFCLISPQLIKSHLVRDLWVVTAPWE